MVLPRETPGKNIFGAECGEEENSLSRRRRVVEEFSLVVVVEGLCLSVSLSRCVLGLIYTPKILKNMKIEFSVEIHLKWSGF